MESRQEGDRLEKKSDSNRIWQQLSRIPFFEGCSVLEVGCGTGAVARTVATNVPHVSIVGLDASQDRINQGQAIADNAGISICFTRGHANKLPFSDNSFDICYARMLFQYLLEPDIVLSEMIRVTKRGGVIAVADLDGQISQWFPIEGFVEEELTAALNLLGKVGFDPYVGRKLYHKFREASLVDISVFLEPYQVYTGGLPEVDLANWKKKASVSTCKLIELTSEAERWTSLCEKLNQMFLRNDTFYYSTFILAQGRK